MASFYRLSLDLQIKPLSYLFFFFLSFLNQNLILGGRRAEIIIAKILIQRVSHQFVQQTQG